MANQILLALLMGLSWPSFPPLFLAGAPNRLLFHGATLLHSVCWCTRRKCLLRVRGEKGVMLQERRGGRCTGRGTRPVVCTHVRRNC